MPAKSRKVILNVFLKKTLKGGPEEYDPLKWEMKKNPLMNYLFQATEPQSINSAKIKTSLISSYFFHFSYRLGEAV